MIGFLKANKDCFGWSQKDMMEINSIVITHKMNVKEGAKPVGQKRRRFSLERNRIINEEVEKLLADGSIREVQYLNRLANAEVVKKRMGNGGSTSTSQT